MSAIVKLTGTQFTDFNHPEHLEKPKLDTKTRISTALASAQSYLAHHAGNLKSTTSTGLQLEENFAQMLIEELSEERYLRLPKFIVK
jgi:hypothetical protein